MLEQAAFQQSQNPVDQSTRIPVLQRRGLIEQLSQKRQTLWSAEILAAVTAFRDGEKSLSQAPDVLEGLRLVVTEDGLDNISDPQHLTAFVSGAYLGTRLAGQILSHDFTTPEIQKLHSVALGEMVRGYGRPAWVVAGQLYKESNGQVALQVDDFPNSQFMESQLSTVKDDNELAAAYGRGMEYSLIRSLVTARRYFGKDVEAHKAWLDQLAVQLHEAYPQQLPPPPQTQP